jgi:DNA-binding NarL/FixJ family response regulator
VIEHRNPIDRYRGRILVSVYGRLLAGAHRVRKRYGASFEDPDLTVEDLSQIGAMKAVECYDWLMAKDPERYFSLAAEDLQQLLVVHATRGMAWYVIDTYRRRDRRREAVAPEELLRLVDESQVARVALWRRVEPLMASLSRRQRSIVQALWEGLDTDMIGAELMVTPNVIQKDVAAIRRLAA